MFYGATAFNGDTISWDVSSGTSFVSSEHISFGFRLNMHYDCFLIDPSNSYQLFSLFLWQMDMFAGATNINEPLVSSWNWKLPDGYDIVSREHSFGIRLMIVSLLNLPTHMNFCFSFLAGSNVLKAPGFDLTRFELYKMTEDGSSSFVVSARG
jgi:hypothetical protein